MDNILSKKYKKDERSLFSSIVVLAITAFVLVAWGVLLYKLMYEVAEQIFKLVLGFPIIAAIIIVLMV